ncbi:MAG TPA: hypothetical protein VNO43_06120 [Candidatus Eisenbacteria bacterium]|nr:hypothetical protein [Candidatus Eisenbacteria bacterium]
MSENGTLGFAGTIRNALNLGVDNKRLDHLIGLMPSEVDFRKRNIPNITKDDLRRVRGTGVGYYTFRFNQLFGNAEDVYLCQVETLRADLIRFFEGIDAASDELRSYVLFSDKENTSEHLHYSTYYAPELADLVLVRDRPLIERFGFAFENPARNVDAT